MRNGLGKRIIGGASQVLLVLSQSAKVLKIEGLL